MAKSDLLKRFLLWPPFYKSKLRATGKTEEPDLVKKPFEQVKAKELSVCIGDSPEGPRKDETGTCRVWIQMGCPFRLPVCIDFGGRMPVGIVS